MCTCCYFTYLWENSWENLKPIFKSGKFIFVGFHWRFVHINIIVKALVINSLQFMNYLLTPFWGHVFMHWNVELKNVLFLFFEAVAYILYIIKCVPTFRIKLCSVSTVIINPIFRFAKTFFGRFLRSFLFFLSLNEVIKITLCSHSSTRTLRKLKFRI